MTPPRLRPLAVGLLLGVAVVAVYWPILGSDFIRVFDDGTYVAENPHVAAGLSLEGVRWAFTTTRASNWHPLTWLSLMLDTQLFGTGPRGPHAINLLLHLANSLLLLAVLERMTRLLWRSAFVAAVFALHPLHVESVAWIAERKDVLSALFWILAMHAYLRYARRPTAGRQLPVVAAFVAGSLAKPMLVSLPLVLLLLDFWPLGRLEGGPPGTVERQRPLGSLVREKAILIALAGASAAITLIAQRRGGALAGLERYPLETRAANAVVAYDGYLGKALWPSRLAVFYPHPGAALPGWQVAASALVLLAASAISLRWARRCPALVVGWLWYLVTLLPVIGLVQVGSQAAADRYTYLPLIGPSLILAWGLPDLVARKIARGRAGRPSPDAVPRAALLFAAGLALAALIGCTRRQVSTWRSGVTLFERAAAVSGGSIVENNLGVALADEDRLEEAVVHYRAALAARPGYTVARYNLANALLGLNRGEEAIGEYREVVREDPLHAKAQNNLGRALIAQGDWAEAIDRFREAVRLEPGWAEAHANLGAALARQGSADEALVHLSEAIRILPDLAEAHVNLARLYARKGRTDDAVREFRAAIRIRSDLAPAHEGLAITLFGQGLYAEAWREVHTMRRLGTSPDPAFVRALASRMAEPPN